MKRAVAVAAAAALAWPATSAAAPKCGPSTAKQLQHRLPVKPYGERYLGQVKCFDFTGDRRKDIVFTGWEFMNHGAHYWAAFRATRGNWTRVKFKRGCCRADPKVGAGIGINRFKRTIIVRQPVYRRDDPACCPSGGSKEGRWRWRNARLVLVRVTTEPPEAEDAAARALTASGLRGSPW